MTRECLLNNELPVIQQNGFLLHQNCELFREGPLLGQIYLYAEKYC